MDEWFEKGIERWEQFAEDHSCDRMELVGRRGWLRAFKGLKFREKYVTLEKDLRARH